MKIECTHAELEFFKNCILDDGYSIGQSDNFPEFGIDIRNVFNGDILLKVEGVFTDSIEDENG